LLFLSKTLFDEGAYAVLPPFQVPGLMRRVMKPCERMIVEWTVLKRLMTSLERLSVFRNAEERVQEFVLPAVECL
jgi:hypothetical protein